MGDDRFLWALVSVVAASLVGMVGLTLPWVPFVDLFVQGFLVLAVGLLVSAIFFGSDRE